MKKMQRLFAVSLALSAVGAFARSAAAAELDFDYVESIPPAELVANWTQSDPPTVISSAKGVSTEVSANGHDALIVIGMSFGGGNLTDITFYSAASGGGFNDGDIVSDHGQQLYTGSEAAPVFAPGVYALNAGTLTITAVPVPEPASWAMMLTGLGLVGWAARRRQKVRVAYA